jgi:hypothetical protein
MEILNDSKTRKHLIEYSVFLVYTIMKKMNSFIRIRKLYLESELSISFFSFQAVVIFRPFSSCVTASARTAFDIIYLITFFQMLYFTKPLFS